MNGAFASEIRSLIDAGEFESKMWYSPGSEEKGDDGLFYVTPAMYYVSSSFKPISMHGDVRAVFSVEEEEAISKQISRPRLLRDAAASLATRLEGIAKQIRELDFDAEAQSEKAN